jgi:hypothetical protein
MNEALTVLIVALAAMFTWALVGPAWRVFRVLPVVDRTLCVLVGVVGILVRLWFTPWGMAPVPDILATRLLLTSQNQQVHPVYGGGLNAIGVAWNTITGSGITGLFTLNFGMACVLPLLVWSLARMCVDEPKKTAAGGFAGILAALLPVHVMVSASVFEQVIVSTLCLVALISVTAQMDRGGLGLLAGLVGAFLAHLRPETLPFVCLMGGLLFVGAGPGRSARWTGGVICLGFVLLRTAQMNDSTWDLGQRVLLVNSDLPLSDILRGLVLTPFMNSHGATPPVVNVFADPASTPVVAWPVALCGWISCLHRRKGWLALAWLLLFLPVCLRGRPFSDALRMQLPSMVVACTLFGIGSSILFQKSIVRWAGLTAIVGLAVPMLNQGDEPWVVSQTLPIMNEGTSVIPAEASVVLPRYNRYAIDQAALVSELRGLPSGQSVALGHLDEIPTGEVWLWWPMLCSRSLLKDAAMMRPDYRACDRFDDCELTAMKEVFLRGRVEEKWQSPADGIRVGWYRVEGCGA